MSSIARPEMRWDLISGVEVFAFPDLVKSGVRGIASTIDFAVNMVFDDMEMHEDPHQWIGRWLLDALEADQGLKLCSAYMVVQNAVGPRAPDSKYLAHRGWPVVVEEARKLLKLLYRDIAGMPGGAEFKDRLDDLGC